MPMVSVIITTKNSATTLNTLLKSIMKQTYKKIETIVVDNNSNDQTKEIARRFTDKVFNKGPERSAQRNFGVDKSKGECVFILDSDMTLEKNVLEECINEATEYSAIIIPERSFGEGFWAQFKVFEREFYIDEEDIEAPRFFAKKMFQSFGGYDLSITGPEDWDLPLRMKKAGIQFGRIKSFILHNEGKYSPWKSAKKKFYYASGARVFLSRHPESIINKGNLLFRPVFFRKWKKLISSPVLTPGMFFIRTLEMAGAGSGIIWSFVKYTTRFK